MIEGALFDAAQALRDLADHKTRSRWSQHHIDIVRDYYPHVPTAVLAAVLGRSEGAVYQQARNLGVRKSEEYLASPLAGRTGHDTRGGRTRFAKGHRPWNKGRKGWQAGGRARETQFKPGQLNGRAAALHQPVGAERINADGYRARKIRDDGPPKDRWKAVHVLLWESARGPVPAGHAVVFRNGDKTDIRLANLELISRADLMRRNTRHRYPEDINRAIAAKAALTRRINKLERRT